MYGGDDWHFDMLKEEEDVEDDDCKNIMEKVNNASIGCLLKVSQGCNRVPNNKPIIHCVELEGLSGLVYDGLLARLCHFVPSVQISNSKLCQKHFVMDHLCASSGTKVVCNV